MLKHIPVPVLLGKGRRMRNVSAPNLSIPDDRMPALAEQFVRRRKNVCFSKCHRDVFSQINITVFSIFPIESFDRS